MIFEEALTAPVLGDLILSWLYADEQVHAFNLSWELREHFIGSILEIRHGLNAWGHRQFDLFVDRAANEDLRRCFLRDWGHDEDESSHSDSGSSWG